MSHSEHRFPTPSSRDVVNQCLEFGEVCVCGGLKYLLKNRALRWPSASLADLSGFSHCH